MNIGAGFLGPTPGVAKIKMVKSKCKVSPITGHEGTEGE
jgi:hypothetical protein